MIKFIRKVSEWGIRPDTPYNQALHYRLTNVLMLFMLFASFGQSAFCYLTGAVDAAVMNSTAPMTFAIGLWLMKKGKTVLARLFVLTVCYTAGYAVVASLGPDSYFQFIYLFSSAFSLVFFSFDEKKLLVFGLVTPLICFAALEISDYRPILGMTRANLSDFQTLTIRIGSTTIVWTLMVFHFFYFIRDRRKSQEQLISSAKMEALGRMAAGIAHEINNPLQIIVYHADRLKGLAPLNAATSDQTRTSSEKIQKVAMRIATLTKGLLALSRDSSGDPMVEVSIQEIVKLSLDYSKAHLESQDVEVRVRDIPANWTVIGRETQLSEVILNVLNNAYDAVLDSPQKWIQIEASAEKDFVEVAISDSGPGVNPILLDRIFDPFFTTKPVGKGTGLGLSISRGIMDAHGGQITYDPKSTGARFVIRIPRGGDRELPQESTDRPSSISMS